MKKTASVNCTFPGCKEVGRWNYDSVKECVAHYPQRVKWRCTRHSTPDEVLGIENPSRCVTLVASKVDGCGSLLFWVAPEKHLKSGFTFGNGYKAYANDFPEGTKLTVTASIELPDPTFPKKELAGGADS